MPTSGRLEVCDVEEELQTFSYIVSHDLAASFRHVAEFSRLLVGACGDEMTAVQQDHARHIRAAADKGQTMMDELLAFSRVQQKTLERVRQDATPFLQIALSQLPVFESAAADVSLTPLGEVYADPTLLTLAVHHLMENAIKFHRPGVRSRILIEPAHDEATWRMRITDNGLGIEAAYREKAFRMFQRLNAEDAYPGVGAGLAISRRIARRHGGDVGFLDCSGGACVELALPRPAPLQ